MEAGRKDGIFPGGCRLECCAADHKVYRLDFPDGCGRMTVYPVLPGLRLIPSGWALILCAILAAVFGALRFPVEASGEEAAV